MKNIAQFIDGYVMPALSKCVSEARGAGRSSGTWVRRLFATPVVFALVISGYPHIAQSAATVNTTTVAASVNPVTVGSATVLTASVTGASGSGPTGTVTFKRGSTNLGTGSLSGTGLTRTATYSATFSTVNTYNITAVYGGNSTYKTSTSSALSLTVKPAPTASTIDLWVTQVALGFGTAFPSGSSPGNWPDDTYGHQITLLGNVITLNYLPTGTVSYYSGTTLLGTEVIQANGSISGMTFTLPVGTHVLKAVYSGDGNNLPVTSVTGTGVMQKASSSVPLSSSTNPSPSGSALTFSVSIPAAGPGAAAPTGTVSFKDGATTLGSAALSSGAASFTSSTLSSGTHPITVAYTGDSNYNASTSSVLNQVIAGTAPTTTAISVAATNSVYGSANTVTATVAGANPSGSVTFNDGATVLGTVSLASGVATYSLKNLSAGTHSITASYTGDAINAGSTSSAVAVTVAKAPSTVAVSANPNPGFVGGVQYITATIPGGDATGNVVFYDDGVQIGTAAAVAGAATFSTSSLSKSTHSITAGYAGDSNYLGSTSSAFSLVIGGANPNINWNTTPASRVYSSVTPSVSYTIQVRGDYVTYPTGTIDILENGVIRASGVALSNGSATFTMSPTPGVHPFTAVYAGDANYGASSVLFTQTITAPQTATTISSNLSSITYGGALTITSTVSNGCAAGVGIQLYDGPTLVGTKYAGSLSGSAGGSWSCSVSWSWPGVSNLTGGTHSFTVVYPGSSVAIGSTSNPLTVEVTKAATTVTLSAIPVSGTLSTLTAGGLVKLTGTVPYGTGTVNFYDNGVLLGSSAANIQASFPLVSLGVHSLTANYLGDQNTLPSTSSAVSATVTTKASPSLTLAASPQYSAYGSAVSLTATLSPNTSPAVGVNFYDAGVLIGTSNVVNGSAVLTLSGWVPGLHQITASFAGDANTDPATSSALTASVANAIPVITLTSSNPVAQSTSAIDLTASITGYVPTGSISFRSGSDLIGSAAISNGAASLTGLSLTPGMHGITASYVGDANNTPAVSNTYLQSITSPTTVLTLEATPASASVGQSVLLKAVANGVSPQGVVTFYDGAVNIGSAEMDPVSAVASFSTSNLAIGSHSISATYMDTVRNQATSSSVVSVSVVATAGMTWQYGYDAMGRINTKVDPNGNATHIYYDSLGRAIQTQQPPNTGSSSPTVTGYSYNLADSLTQVADPRNLATNYTPNGLGKVTSQSSPDTGSTQYTYDAKGNVLTSTDARSKTTTYAYDNSNRVTSISYSTGSATTFEYDGGTTPTPAEKGELTKMTDESGQTTYAHDALGRLTTKTTTISGKTFTTSYSWGDTGSAMDKLTAITYPSGTKVNYAYDAQGYVSGVTVNPVNANGVGVSGSTVTLLNGISYNAENKVTGWLWVDGKARTIAYDSNGMVTAYNLGDALGTGSAAGNLRTVARDAAGRITGYSHTNNGTAQTSLNQGFGYDNLNRLLSASLAGSSTQYSYDETGNRTSKTIAGTTYTNTVASTSNRLTQTQDVPGTAAIQYDAAGHITNDGSNSFTYSDRGRMTSATNAGGTVSYQYNGLNQRVYKSGPTALVPTGSAYYLYDEQGQLLGEYDSNGAPVYETVYLGGMPVGVLKQAGSAANGDIATTMYNVHADHIATARVITQQDQAIVWRWDTAEAFGGTVPDQNPSGIGTFVYNQRFPGQVFDAETGLFQNWNREYNARQGRYVQSDPIGLKGGINTFAYTESNPISGFDQTGLDCTAVGDTVSCNVPDGPQISFPRPPDWPDYIGPGSTNYHSYNEWVNTSGINKACLEDYIRNRPTPGSPSPASADGTSNDATPNPLSAFGPSPVRTYLRTSNGNQVIVNVTMPGHPLFPGYVARTVESGPSNNQLNNYGEGTGWRQADWSPFARPINNVWQWLSDDAIKACGCGR